MTDPLRYHLGIDFGTTHTVAALGRPDGRVQSLLFASSPLLPSAVFADRDGRLLTGNDALRSARLEPARFEPNVKHRIDEPAVLLGDREFEVVDLVAAVLARVFDEAVRVAGGPPARTVLTHPAGWGATRRGVLTRAAERAGLGTVALIPEPLAAALYFAREHPGDALVVYDFGAGTFDVSVLGRGPDGAWQVLATDGLTDVGGLDLDEAIVRHLRITTAPESRWPLLDEVRAAKEQLSRTSTAVIRVPGGADVHLTREEFESLARPWLDRTVALTANTIARAHAPARVSTVLLVGGSSRIPLVATLLHQRLSVAPTVLDQPELVVAEGSLQAFAPAQSPRAAGPVAAGAAAAAVPPAGLAGAALAAGGPATAAGGPPAWSDRIPVAPVAGPAARWPKLVGAGLAVAVLGAGGVLGYNRLHKPHGTGNPTTGHSITTDKVIPTTPPPTPSTSASAGPTYVVVYSVTASGRSNSGSVQYTDQDGAIITKGGIPLPWRLTFTVHKRQPLVLITQRHNGGDAGPVTCTITVNGKTLSTTTATGRFAAPECSGSVA